MYHKVAAVWKRDPIQYFLGDYTENKLLNFLDGLFLLDLGVYLFYLETCLTTFPSWTGSIELELFRSTLAIVLVRFGLYILTASRNRLRDLAVAAIIAIAFFGSYFATRYLSLLFFFLFFVGAIGFDYRKLMKCFVIVIGTTFLVAVISSLCGSIENVSFWDFHAGMPVIRSSWGIVYCTDCAAVLLFLTITVYALFQKCPDIIFAPISLLGFLFSWYICNARNSAALFAVCFLFSIVYALYDRFLKQYGIAERILKCLFYLAGFFAPIAAVAEVIMTKLYTGAEQSGFLYLFNQLSTGRLALQKSALDTYGIKLFGTAFDLISAGIGGLGAKLGYNFIDCGYMLVLIQFGLIPLIVLLSGMVFVSIKAVRQRNYRLAFVILIIALHSVLEHHMPELRYNIFLLVPCCLLGREPVSAEPYRLKDLPWKKIIVTSILPLLCLTLINPIISLLRTFAQILSSPVEFGLIILALLILFVLLEVGLVQIVDRKKTGIVLAIISGVCLIVFWTGMICHLNQSAGVYAHDETIVSDAESIALLKSVDGATIYAAEYPYFYRKLYEIGEDTVLPKEDLARLSDITVIVDAEFDSRSYFGKGFVYTPISEHFGIYTDDEKVISVFQKNGYTFTNYLTTVHDIDLNEMADLNELKLNDDGAVLVPKESSIQNGPSVSITSGHYTLTYELSADTQELKNLNADTQVAMVVITVYDGQTSAGSVAVKASEFDSSGHAEIKVNFAPGTYDNVEFKLTEVNQCDLKVDGITYWKNS